MKLTLGVLLSLVVLSLSCASTPGVGPDTQGSDAEPLPGTSLVVGVFPFAPAAQIDELYGPLIQAMAAEFGMSVRLRTAGSFDTFSANLAADHYDIAVVQPFEYPELIDRGYRPIVRVEQMLSATIVADTDLKLAVAGIAGIVDLRIGTPPEASAMWALLEAELIAVGEDLSRLDIQSFSTHADCLGQMRLDAVDVCAVGPVPLRQFEQQVNETLHVVAITEPVSSMAVVANPSLSATDFSHVQAFLLGLDEDPDTQPLLALIGTPKFVLIEAGDYERVRALMDLRSPQ